MRAALLRNIGDAELEVRDDIELVDVGAGEVKVKIEATGVCHSDLSCMNGTIPQPAPAVLGHEGAGVIAEVGEGVTDVKVGDHVIVAWSPPCGECAFCGPRHQPNLCSNIQMVMGGTPHFTLDGSPVFGMAGAGTFAEEMIIPHQGVVKIDDDIPLEIGSLIGCGVMTGVGAAINTAKVTPGSSVIVFGCGGVGISCIQGAKVAGASVIVAVDLNDGKLEDAKRFGATHSCKPDEVDSLKASPHRRRRVRLLLRGHRPAHHDAGGLRRHPPRRHGLHRRRRQARRVRELLRLRAVLLREEPRRLVLRLGRRAHRLPQAPGLLEGRQLDLDGMITRRIKLDEINDAFDAMKRGEVIRQVISF